MGLDQVKYANEISDFLCTQTLYEIDCGILDLSHVRDAELREVFWILEELLTVELMLNYALNGTGIFRVHKFADVWCYCEGHCVITAGSCSELEKSVISQMGIWYVFDENLAERARGFE